MAVKYRLRKRPTNLSKDIEDGFYPQVIRSDNVDSKGLASYVTGDRGFRSAAMLGAIEQIKEGIISLLEDGNSVSISGLGTFTLTAQSRLVKDPKEIRAGSISVKDVVFKVSPELMQRLRSVQFERE